MNKRSNFYPNGEIIDFRLPQDFRPSSGRGSCGNCGQYSNKRSFCNIYKSYAWPCQDTCRSRLFFFM